MRRINPTILGFAVVATFLYAQGPTVHAADAPTIIWGSDPVRPNEAVLLEGEDLGPKPVVEAGRLPDALATAPQGEQPPVRWERIPSLQASECSLKFVAPKDWRMGVFACRVGVGERVSNIRLLNAPDPWWLQGDAGGAASPGGWVRVFGKCLALKDEPRPQGQAKLLLQGLKTCTLVADGDSYAVKSSLPEELPPGEYQVFVHNGCGGDAAWSKPLKLTIATPRAWPQTVFSVRESGAAGDGLADDTAAVEAALKKAEANGGGIVYFPRGRYQLNATLHVPPRTVLRGEREDLTQIFWGTGADAWNRTPTDRFHCVIQGTHDFGLEDLMLWFVNADNGLLADEKGEDAGNVFLCRVRMQWLLYGGYITIAQANDIFKQTALDGGAGAKGMLLRLGGRNIVISDCDM